MSINDIFKTKNADNRVFLKVPYGSRRECSFYGGKWDKDKKQWYYKTDDDINKEELDKWLKEPEKIYYRIHYDRREKAKRLGLHFDKDKKKWFHYKGEEIDTEAIRELERF